MGPAGRSGLGSTFAVWASAAPCLPCVVARTCALQKATRLSNDPRCYWQLPRRRLPSRAALVCRRHFRIFRQVADTSPPRAEGNHPNPCLSWRVRPLLMAQDDKDKIRYSETVFRSCPPGPNTWTLNIQPLGQFRPHRGFLLARSTLLSSVARLLHTAGGRAVPSLCGLLLARAMSCAVARTHSKRRARIVMTTRPPSSARDAPRFRLSGFMEYRQRIGLTPP